jgi:hypothetical protein
MHMCFSFEDDVLLRMKLHQPKAVLRGRPVLTSMYVHVHGPVLISMYVHVLGRPDKILCT